MATVKGQCRFCDAKFAYKSRSIKHEQMSHIGGVDIVYKCEICNKCFNQKGCLIIHRRKHTGFKPFQCHYCHNVYTKEFYRKSHEWNKHGRF